MNFKAKVDSPRRPVIWDTDWWTDVDDAVAARVLVWAERAGLIQILGVVLDACMPDSVPSLDAFFTAEGRRNLPIGIDHKATDFGGNPPYQTRMARAGRNCRSNQEAEAAPTFYRRILAEFSQKVDLICIGFGNALAALLASEPDHLSPLAGMDMVVEKVNRLWWMAGYWPEGSENNIARNQRSRKSAHYIVENWPTPITFLGYEVGESVITGGELVKTSPANDLLAQALIDHGSPEGRSSWDPMLTLLACIGDPDAAGYDVVVGTAAVDEATGVNSFKVDPAGKHQYVVKRHPDSWYAETINGILRSGQSSDDRGEINAVEK